MLTTSEVPGLEIRIPKGAVLRDHDGKIVTQVAIVPLPLDRSPFPFPENAPAYVTVQPGGMAVQGLTPATSAGIRVHYPNQTDLAPGTRVAFWSYNTDQRGWQIYGEGQASTDGRQVVPDAGVGLYESVGFMYTEGNPPPPPSSPPPGGGPGDGPGDGSNGGGDNGDNGGPDSENDGPDGKSGNGPPSNGNDDGGDNSGSGSGGSTCNSAMAGDPVDCKSGLFVLSRTDTVVRGYIPISLTRIYRPADPVTRSFGNGNQTGYAMYLREVSNAPNGRYTQYDIILPDGSYVRFNRTSPGNNYTQVIAPHYTSASSWYASVLDYENGNYVVTKKNGTKYIFSLYGTLQTIQDRRGNHLDIAHNGGQITRITTTSGRYLDFQYDSSNRITQMTDLAGRVWRYQYTGQNLTQVTYPNSMIETYGYDAAGNMLTLRDRNSNAVVTNQYDANNRVAQQTTADGGIFHFNYTLDGSGRVTQTNVTDPAGKVRVVTYGALGYKASVTYASGLPSAQSTTYERDSTSGLLTAIVDARSRRTEFHRDAFGNITQVVQLAGTAGAISRNYEFNNPFQLVTKFTDSLNHSTIFGYDALGNLTSLKDGANHTGTLTRNAIGQILSISDALNHTWHFAYDPNGDVRSASNPLGQSVTRNIDALGRTIGVVDARGYQTSAHYNSMGRVDSAADPLGQVTTFDYDNNGNMVRVRDPSGGVTQYTYDLMNRTTSRTDALGQKESWTYSSAGHLLTYTDRKNQTTHYQTDDLGRTSLVTFADGSTITPLYDTANRVTAMVDSISGTINRSFDELGRITQEQTPQGIVNYSYDAVGRRSTMTPANQSQITYTWDAANRLSNIAQSSQNTAITYDDADRRATLTLPNGIVATYAYDNSGRITGIIYKNSAGVVLAPLSYGFDTGGQKISSSGSLGTEMLPTASSGADTYDLNNRQSIWNGFTLNYDTDGDLMANAGSSPSTSYVFDVRHRLTMVKQGSTTIASYTYDAMNRRSTKTIGGVTTSYLYDGLNPVQETQGSAVNSILTGLRMDERFSRDEAGAKRYFLTDALGSTIALTDAAGAIQQTYAYEPYGEVSSTGTSSNPYQYTGRENDGIGLYYYRSRYYSPSLKRFISEDPMGLRAGLNSYAYVKDNPIMFSDPSGLGPDPAGCFFSAGGAPGCGNMTPPDWQQGVPIQAACSDDAACEAYMYYAGGAMVVTGAGAIADLGAAGVAGIILMGNAIGDATVPFIEGTAQEFFEGNLIQEIEQTGDNSFLDFFKETFSTEPPPPDLPVPESPNGILPVVPLPDDGQNPSGICP